MSAPSRFTNLHKWKPCRKWVDFPNLYADKNILPYYSGVYWAEKFGSTRPTFLYGGSHFGLLFVTRCSCCGGSSFDPIVFSLFSKQCGMPHQEEVGRFRGSKRP